MSDDSDDEFYAQLLADNAQEKIDIPYNLVELSSIAIPEIESNVTDYLKMERLIMDYRSQAFLLDTIIQGNGLTNTVNVSDEMKKINHQLSEIINDEIPEFDAEKDKEYIEDLKNLFRSVKMKPLLDTIYEILKKEIQIIKEGQQDLSNVQLSAEASKQFDVISESLEHLKNDYYANGDEVLKKAIKDKLRDVKKENCPIVISLMKKTGIFKKFKEFAKTDSELQAFFNLAGVNINDP